MDFLALLRRLADRGVEFVIVGGYASTILGSDLLTQDLEICIRLGPGNLDRLYDAIEDLHPRYRMHPGKPALTRDAATADAIKNLYLLTDVGHWTAWAPCWESATMMPSSQRRVRSG